MARVKYLKIVCIYCHSGLMTAQTGIRGKYYRCQNPNCKKVLNKEPTIRIKKDNY